MRSDSLRLEHKLHMWAYGDLLPTALVAGDPRCYVDLQIADQLTGAERGLVIVPDVLRQSLAEAVARLAS